jgi:hypothetical protein
MKPQKASSRDQSSTSTCIQISSRSHKNFKKCLELTRFIDFPQLTSRVIDILEKLIDAQLHCKEHGDSQLPSQTLANYPYPQRNEFRPHPLILKF